MKKFTFLSLFFLTFTTTQVIADNNEDIEKARKMAQEQKKVIVLENLNLSDAEQKAFLPVYEDYQMARGHNNEKLGRLIVEFAENYDTMTNDKALELLNHTMANRQGRLSIKKDFVSKFKAVLPGKKVARYYQIESKLEALAEVKLAEVIPLIQ